MSLYYETDHDIKRITERDVVAFAQEIFSSFSMTVDNQRWGLPTQEDTNSSDYHSGSYIRAKTTQRLYGTENAGIRYVEKHVHESDLSSGDTKWSSQKYHFVGLPENHKITLSAIRENCTIQIQGTEEWKKNILESFILFFRNKRKDL